MSEPLDSSRSSGVGSSSPIPTPPTPPAEGAGINRSISEKESSSPFHYHAEHLGKPVPPIKEREVKAGPGLLSRFGGMAKKLLWDVPKWGLKKTLVDIPVFGLKAASGTERLVGGPVRRSFLKATGAYINYKGESIVKGVTKQAGIELLHHNQETQKNLEALLKNFLQNYALDKVLPAGKHFDFPEIVKKLKGDKKVTVQNLKFEIEPIKEPSTGILTSKGSLSNQFRIKNLSCHINIPFEGFEPMKISVGIKDAKLSVSTNLSLSRAAWEFKQGRKSTYHDATALSLEAEKVNVRYDALSSTQALPHSSEGAKKFLYAFDEGMVTFRDLKFAAPTNLFKKEACQNSYLSFRELHHTCFPKKDMPAVIEIPQIAVCHSDKMNNGRLKAKIEIKPDRLKGFTWKLPIVKIPIPLGSIISFLCPSPLTLDIDCPMVRGEVRLKDLKQSLTITGPLPARTLIGWLLNHPETKLLGTETKPKIQLRGQKGLTVPIPVALAGFQAARSKTSCQGEADRQEGYFVVPSYLSRFCSKCVGTVKGSHFPLTVISGDLEELAEKAIKGDKKAGVQLFQAARNHDQSGHKYEARAALLALPKDQLLEQSRTMKEDSDWQWMIEQAQTLHYHDKEKATELFAELLKQKNIHDESPSVEKPELLLTLGESLLKEKPPKMDVIIQVLEFAHLRDPEKNTKALSLLIELHNKKSYSHERLSRFISQQLAGNSYFKTPDQRLKLLDIMVRYIPEVVQSDLENFPLGDLAERLAKDDMEATDTLALMETLISTARAYNSGAEILIKLNRLDSAIDVLNRGVQSNHSQAISKRAELVARYHGITGHTIDQEIEHLIGRLENPESTPQIVEASARSLGTLIQNEDNDIATLFTRDLTFTDNNSETEEMVLQLKGILQTASGLDLTKVTNPLMLQNYFIREMATPLQQLKALINDKNLPKEVAARLLNRTDAALRVAQYLNDTLSPIAMGLSATGVTSAVSAAATQEPGNSVTRGIERALPRQSRTPQEQIPPLTGEEQINETENSAATDFCDQLLAFRETVPELKRAMKNGLKHQRRAMLQQMSRS
ncbi:hypothetical protein EOPP23_18610 [Endozoicomonas sp. OPT23]|uniref:hypothetical protein n=1 Tax=Endozoicomonas sp. OPT23 TaxID=2072845 RepID=UPI00129AA4AB|nr:hypothetical protein [Endozoicomonas sp. OPT23]MRI34991.1 hypothetical protein [Endozoicomonas sp. OPT23]